MQYRIKNTSEVFPAEQLQQRFPDTSLPLVITADVMAFLDIEEVPDPEPTPAEIAARLTADKAQALLKIDADVDAIYGAVLGNRAEEYSLAATEAKAYKDAGYEGTVPGSVASWATAKGWTATQAADDILDTATQWIAAQAAIRAARLARKEQVRNAVNAAGVTTAMTAWAGFATYIRSQLGVS